MESTKARAFVPHPPPPRFGPGFRRLPHKGKTAVGEPPPVEPAAPLSPPAEAAWAWASRPALQGGAAGDWPVQVPCPPPKRIPRGFQRSVHVRTSAHEAHLEVAAWASSQPAEVKRKVQGVQEACASCTAAGVADRTGQFVGADAAVPHHATPLQHVLWSCKAGTAQRADVAAAVPPEQSAQSAVEGTAPNHASEDFNNGVYDVMLFVQPAKEVADMLGQRALGRGDADVGHMANAAAAVTWAPEVQEVVAAHAVAGVEGTESQTYLRRFADAAAEPPLGEVSRASSDSTDAGDAVVASHSVVATGTLSWMTRKHRMLRRTLVDEMGGCGSEPFAAAYGRREDSPPPASSAAPSSPSSHLPRLWCQTESIFAGSDHEDALSSWDPTRGDDFDVAFVRG